MISQMEHLTSSSTARLSLVGVKRCLQKIIRRQKVFFCGCFAIATFILLLCSGKLVSPRVFLDFIYLRWLNSNLEKSEGVSGVFSFYNVCIEQLSYPAVSHLEANFSETKKIVVYGDYSRIAGQHRLPVAGSPNSLWNHWNIEFRHERLQLDNVSKYYRNTAFFVQPTCPGNFHHFLIDEYLPLYSVVLLANSLYRDADNQILYRTPQRNTELSCYDRQRYEEILWTLHTRKLHDVFYNLPANTCFRKAVFGSRISLERKRDAIDHILANLLLSNSSRTHTSDLYVTILSRQRRRILNEDELSRLATSVGFRNVRVVDFEKLTVTEQIGVASSSCVLVGVQGAGLQWAVFMPEGSHLVEIAWPSKYWGFYYHGFVQEFGINHHAVEVAGVRENWTSYEASVRHGVQVGDAEKTEMLRSPPKSTADNLWKWADVLVAEKEIFKTLQEIYEAMNSH